MDVSNDKLMTSTVQGGVEDCGLVFFIKLTTILKTKECLNARMLMVF
jgi:hypothetical protein